MSNFCTNCGSPIDEIQQFCSQCGNRVEKTGNKEDKTDLLAGKRDRILNSGTNSKSGNLVRISYFVVPILFGLFALSKYLPSMTNPVIDKQPVVTGEQQYPEVNRNMRKVPYESKNGKIIISLKDVLEKKLVRFDYTKNGRAVPIAAYISEEGKLVTAISVCEPCKSTTFHIKGEKLICNSCGTTWKLDNLAGVSGSCQKFPPDPVPSTVQGDKILIDERFVINWKPRV